MVDSGQQREPATGLTLLTVVALALALATWAAWVAWDASRALAHQQERVDEQARVIARSVWVFDLQTMDEYLSLATAANGYRDLLVEDLDGNRLHRIAGPAPDRLQALAEGLGLSPVLPLEATVERNGQTLARLRVSWPRHRLERQAVALLVTLLAAATVALVLRLAASHRLLEARVARRTAELAASQARYRAVADNFPAGFIAVGDDRGRLTFIAGRDLDQQRGLTGHRLVALVPRARRADLQAALARVLAGGEERAEVYLGQRLHELHGLPLAHDEHRTALIIGRDVTEERRISEQLNQARRLESIGRLAGGIAHDFNNMLGGILGSAEHLRRRCPDPQLHHHLEAIIDTSLRAGEQTRKLLDFSRKGKEVEQAVDFHRCLDNAIAIFTPALDPRVALRADPAATVTTVIGDPAQLESMILNLLINARDATDPGGTITVTTCDRSVNADQARRHGLEPGDHLELTVADTGSGIPAEVLDRIFEPFFTTKEQGKGTGLGLAATYGTVREHAGAITVASTPGQGATFTLWLPVDRHRQVQTRAVFETRTDASGRILVVDDEELLRIIASQHLVDAGYEVVEAVDGIAAEERFLAEGPFAVVLLDLLMPRRNGAETFAALRAHDPGLAVIIASGFTDDADIDALLAAGARGFLQKPYRRQDLLAAIAAATNRASVE